MTSRPLIILILVFLLYTSSLLFIPSLFEIKEKTYVYSSKIVFANHGENVQNITSTLLTFSIFMNTSWQTAYLKGVNGTHFLTKDIDGNAVIVSNISSLFPNEDASISYSILLKEKSRNPPKINFTSSGNLNDIPEKLREEYTQTNGSWIVNEDLRSLAYTIWSSQGNTSNVLKIALALANWIGNNVKSISHDIPYYPQETYNTLEGDCDDQANLLIAISRILGIPAYLQVGSLKWSTNARNSWNNYIQSTLIGVSYHGWAVIYIPPWGWLPFDMTLGWTINDSLSVITSAKIWNLDTMPMVNITRSDWPGSGRAQKIDVVSGSTYITYSDVLTTVDSNFLSLLLDFRFWSVTITVLTILAFIRFILKRFFTIHKELI